MAKTKALKEKPVKSKKSKKVEKDNVRNKRAQSSDTSDIVFADGAVHDEEEMDLFYSSRKTVKELVSVLGANPNPLDHMIVEENGARLYTMCFYIDKLPRHSDFARTYAPLFNFPNVTSCVFIDPQTAGKSSKQLDRRIVLLDSECIAAEKDQDRNRYRKVSAKMQDAEAYARDVESGGNQLYEVQFLFILQAESLELLQRKSSDFHMAAREKGIELCATYSVHPEAFLSGYPTNRVIKAKHGLLKSTPIKTHVLDKYALLDIFNHTRSYFSHKNGIFAGHVMSTGQPMFYDMYDSSHLGYGIIFTGKTGTGKSACIKMWGSRYIDFDTKIRSIDFEARGPRGEYSIMATTLGGVSFQIKADSDVVLNLFDVDVTDEYDEISGTEYQVFDLASKKVALLQLIMVMIKDGREIDSFSDEKFIRRIVADAITDCFDEHGIKHGDIDSLYEQGSVFVGGKLGSGRVKKKLPTITDFYKRILHKERENKNKFYEKPYRIIVDGMKDSVRELYYCPSCLTFYTREEYLKMQKIQQSALCDCISCHSGQIIEIHGERAYFDGQTTVQVSRECPHINYDISQLPKRERPTAMLICMDHMQENHIKKNSADPRKSKKMIALIDELHRSFPHPEARKFIEDAFRTYRHHHVSPWVATQALADFDGYAETKAIVKNATTIVLLKQDIQDKEFLAKSTPLTASQIEQVCQLGGNLDDENDQKNRKGEVCLIDNQSKVVFMKVDYLEESEALIVETDMDKIQKMYKGGGGASA